MNKEIIKSKPSSSKVQPIKENESLILKKHIDLINCKIAQLSKTQQKFYNTILISATDQLEFNPQKMEKDWFTIDSRVLCKGIGVKRIKRAEIQSAMIALNSTQFVSVDIREDSTKYTGSNLVPEWSFTEANHSKDITEVKFKLPDYVKERLINPKVYAKLPLKEMNKLIGRYAYALGPFLKVNFSEKFQFSRIVSLEDYRAVVGIPDDHFSGRNNNLIQTALVKPLNQLKKFDPELSNIHYEIQKKGRKITGIKFWNKRQNKSKLQTSIPGFQNLIDNFAFKDDVITKLIDKHGEERVRACLAHTFDEFEKRKDTNNPVKNPKAFARSLIEGDFDYEKSQMEMKSETENKIQEIQEQQIKDNAEQIRNLSQDYKNVIKGKVDYYIKALDPKAKEILRAEVLDSLESDELFQDYKDDLDLDNLEKDPYTKGIIVPFIIEKCLPAETFQNYVRNKTGRMIQDLGTGLYQFVDQAEPVIKDAEEVTAELIIDAEKELETFLMAFKIASAKIIVETAESNKMRKVFVVDHDTKDPKALKDLIIDKELNELTIEQVLSFNDAKLLKGKELKIERDGKIMENKAAVAELEKMFPKAIMDVFTIINS